MVALAEHLFSRLIASKDYKIDRFSMHLPKKCPCGCNANIRSGTTTLGSCFTWHGKVDVLLNQTIAVQILNEVVNVSTDDSEDEENSVGLESAEKQLVEVNTKRGKDTLYDLRVLDQVVAEAVTNGFAQGYKQSSPSDLLIPTVGTTSEYFTVFLYDPGNDILLQDTLRFGVWEYREDTKLYMFSVVCLWLFLNSPLFVLKTSEWREKIEVAKSRFHVIMDKKLDRYKEISSQCNPTEISKDESSYGEILDLTCKRIRKN